MSEIPKPESGGLLQLLLAELDDLAESAAFGQRYDLGGGAADGSALLAPLRKSLANVLGVQAEHFADVLIGEGPFPFTGLDPFLGVLEEEPAARIAGERVLLVALDCILQHCEHQASLADKTALTGEGSEVLCRQQSVRLEEVYETVRHGVLVFLGKAFKP